MFLYLNFYSLKPKWSLHDPQIFSHHHLSAVKLLPQLLQPIRLITSAAHPSFAKLTLGVSQPVRQLGT